MNIGLRYAAFAEALTLLVLVFVAMPLKYGAEMPAATSIMGPIHGMMFMLFIWFVIRSWSEGTLERGEAARLIIGAFLPFGGIINERWLRNRRSERSANAL